MFELLDFIETEYFASTLYELLGSTYETSLETLLTDELMKKPEIFIKGVATWENDSHIHVIKLTTLFYKIQESKQIIDSLALQIKLSFT